MNIVDNEKAWSYLYDINIRGEELGTSKKQKTSNNITDLSVHFKIDEYNFIINKKYIELITTISKITTIPQQHEYISGISSIENILFVIVDLKYLLLSKKTTENNKCRAILLNIDNNIPIALLVDNVCGKLPLDQQLAKYDLINNPPVKEISEFIDAAYMYNNTILYNFNANQLLENKKFFSI